MIAPACRHERLVKCGKNRNGSQRWKCRDCQRKITGEYARPLGTMRLDPAKAADVLCMLLEGLSIRACERLTGVRRNVIGDLILTVGQQCEQFLLRTVRNVQSRFIELDKTWSFVMAKAKTVMRKNLGEGIGDSWLWLGIDADSKLILGHHVGQRDSTSCNDFLSRISAATSGKCQVTSDGFKSYVHGVPLAFGSRCSFAQLVKNYSGGQYEHRYSPPRISSITVTPRFGVVDEDRVSTSFAERLNLSVRTHVRRFTRLTNAHSKSLKHHSAMVALFVAFYNLVRRHESLQKTTPAMAAGLTDHVWSMQELLTAVAEGGE
jgi:transposase-like protein/IS1 family transposase